VSGAAVAVAVGGETYGGGGADGVVGAVVVAAVDEAAALIALLSTGHQTAKFLRDDVANNNFLPFEDFFLDANYTSITQTLLTITQREG
jgi:hypothetical protein